MARIEKTVFISYRRTDVYAALAVYKDLTSQGYDVFFDYTSISAGDFEQIIISNIKARAHFLVILAPTTLDRCSEPGDWLRREIETAIDERRNIIPLFFKGFSFGSSSASEKLTGKLMNLSRYNGMNVHEDFFDAAMDRLRGQFLNIPLDAVLRPVSTEVQKVVKEEQIAANKAVLQSNEAEEQARIEAEKIKQTEAEDKAKKEKEARNRKAAEDRARIESEEQASKGKEARDKKNAEERVRKIAEEKLRKDKEARARKALEPQSKPQVERIVDLPVERKIDSTSSTEKSYQLERKNIIPRFATIGVVGLLLLVLVFFGTNYIRQNAFAKNTPTLTDLPIVATSPRLPPPSGPLLIGTSTISLKDHMSLMYVPAGEFIMGSDNGNNDEKPARKVILDAFWIDQTEVTNAMYAKCVQDGKCIPPSSIKSSTRNSYFGNTEFDNYPVIYVDWNMAKTYCEWAGRKLPTEAEWEKAARGTDGNLYPWGNNAPNNNMLNYNNSVGDTTVVIKYYSKGNSIYGALDMAGNVWEWVNDWYDVYPGGDSNVSSDFGQKFRVLRGGAWDDSDFNVRSDLRNKHDPADTDASIGFRCSSSQSSQ